MHRRDQSVQMITHTHGELATRPLEGVVSIVWCERDARDVDLLALVCACHDDGVQNTPIDDLTHQHACAVAQAAIGIQIAQEHDGHVGLELDVMLRQPWCFKAVEHFFCHAHMIGLVAA